MTTYLTKPTEELALEASRQEAIARRCNGTTTEFWYPVRVCSMGMYHVICADDADAVNGEETHSNEPTWPPENPEL